MLRRSILASLCLLGPLVAGCSKSDDNSPANGSGQPGKQLNIGFSQVGAEGPSRAAETKSIVSEAGKRGFILSFADAQGDQENQIKALQAFRSAGVDVIILAPKTDKGWEAALKDVKTAGIPVVLVGRDVDVTDPSLYATLICSDFVDEGRRAAEWLVKKTKGSANIAELLGAPGDSQALDRQKGFEDAVKRFPGMKIVKPQNGDSASTKGKDVMEAFLKSPQGASINAVYAVDDDLALGAIPAIEAAGKVPGKDIIILSIGGTKAALQAIIDGKVNCVIECNPLVGPAAFDAISAGVAGKTPDRKILSKDALFDDTNAKDALAGRMY